MRKKDNRRESKVYRYMKAPLRFLVMARDMYVKGMVQCSSNFSYVDAAMGCPTTGHIYTLPRSFSVNSTGSNASDEDFKELVRVASLRSRSERVAMKVPQRSRSVGIGRIEEDKACEFGDEDEDDINVKPLLYSRSRSHAIRNTTRPAFF